MSDPKTHIGKYGETLGTRTRRALNVRSWLYPLIGAGLVIIVSVPTRVTLERALEEDVRADLVSLLDTEVSAIRIWLQWHRSTADLILRDADIRAQVDQLLVLGRQGVDAASLLAAPAQGALRERMAPIIRGGKYAGYVIVDPAGRILGSLRDIAVGASASEEKGPLLRRALGGETVVTPPFPFAVRGPAGPIEPEVPAMLVIEPLRDAAGLVVGLFGLRLDPHEFTNLLEIGQSRESVETYAFDRKGLMISHSRFDDQLRKVGLLPPDEKVGSFLKVHLRDPGGNLLEGHRTTLPVEAQPLTRMAMAAVLGQDGVDVDGYRDYRGVPVVGAWRWLDEYEIGVATEIDKREAYWSLQILRIAFGALFCLLVLGAAAVFVYSRINYALRCRVSEAMELGQYMLVEKIGEGGMGEVYRARHALLQRPVALKILRASATSEENLGRFEREVQLTSRLNHPNTIAVFDYGRTPEGIFYYVMEYIEGYSLSQMVKRWGPVPAARVVHILSQVCGSLAEAHDAGLIHRDIKPSNILLSRHGGIPDMVKVVDFGLAREVLAGPEPGITAPGMITGTPLYMAPESILKPGQVDARSDLYALGAVGYYMLCGHYVFDADTAVEVCAKHVQEKPVPPSARSSERIPTALEAIILRCLEKDPARRPQTARELRSLIEAACPGSAWSEEGASDWWREHPPAAPAPEQKEETRPNVGPTPRVLPPS